MLIFGISSAAEMVTIRSTLERAGAAAISKKQENLS